MNGIDESIRSLERMAKALDQAIAALGQGEARDGEQSAPSTVRQPRRRHLSAAGRKRISEAARKRWAALRATQGSATKTTVKKPRNRRISAEARKRIAETAKRAATAE